MTALRAVAVQFELVGFDGKSVAGCDLCLEPLDGGVTGPTLEIRWDRGLADINDTGTDASARNRAVMLMAGLSF